VVNDSERMTTAEDSEQIEVEKAKNRSETLMSCGSFFQKFHICISTGISYYMSINLLCKIAQLFNGVQALDNRLSFAER